MMKISREVAYGHGVLVKCAEWGLTPEQVAEIAVQTQDARLYEMAKLAAGAEQAVKAVARRGGGLRGDLADIGDILSGKLRKGDTQRISGPAATSAGSAPVSTGTAPKPTPKSAPSDAGPPPRVTQRPEKPKAEAMPREAPVSTSTPMSAPKPKADPPQAAPPQAAPAEELGFWERQKNRATGAAHRMGDAAHAVPGLPAAWRSDAPGAFGDQLREAAPALAAAAALPALGAGTAYMASPADTLPNHLRGLVGMDQRSRLDYLFG